MRQHKTKDRVVHDVEGVWEKCILTGNLAPEAHGCFDPTTKKGKGRIKAAKSAKTRFTSELSNTAYHGDGLRFLECGLVSKAVTRFGLFGKATSVSQEARVRFGERLGGGGLRL